MRELKIQAEGHGHCVFLINSLSDGAVYTCFRTIARRWAAKLTSEALSIEGGAHLTPSFTANSIPSSIETLLAANADVIETVVLEFGGFKVCFVRSGGSGPALYRRSYFDEVKFELNGTSTLSYDEIRDIAAIVCESLEASAVTGTPDFASLTDALPIKVRTFSAEERA